MEPKLSSPNTGVIVTGGSTGIGFACARALASVGRPIAILNLPEADPVGAATRLGEEYAVPTIGIAIDLRDLDAFSSTVEQVRAALPSVGGLVHCAGTLDLGFHQGITAETWPDHMDVHLRSFAFLVQAILPDLKANPGSAVVAIASINAFLGNAMNPIYSAGKGGLVALVRSFADRLAADGVRINAVCPGQIRTPMLFPEGVEIPPGLFEERILLERLGEPDEVARLVRFLMSDEASYITAADLVIDGGNLTSQRV